VRPRIRGTLWSRAPKNAPEIRCGRRLRRLFDFEGRAGLVRRPLTQDELKLHPVLHRRLTLEDSVTASDRNHVALSASIGTDAAQVDEEIVCARRAADPDAEGHPVHRVDLPVLGEGKHPLPRQGWRA
jgi:hypothetical protein